MLFQVWEWRDSLYDVDFYVVRHASNESCQAHVMRSTYYAITIAELILLMTRAGFVNVRRVDEVFFQPILTGVRPQ